MSRIHTTATGMGKTKIINESDKTDYLTQKVLIQLMFSNTEFLFIGFIEILNLFPVSTLENGVALL